VSPPEIDASIHADRPDSRDFAYEPPTHAEPPPERVGYERYRDLVGTTWHQRGEECTGFALAAIANYRIRSVLDDPTAPSVSRRMLYELAQLHDGEAFVEGSTLRGALKGWHRTGVARDETWPYHPDDEHGDRHGTLTLSRVLDARHRPLLAYRRIAHDDLDTIRSALAEGHALFASARIHVGWYRLFMPDVESHVERKPGDDDKGGHAFVIVGYDGDGLWVHNSWGPEWGSDGYARLTYDDWLANGHDVWVVDVDPDSLGTSERPDPRPLPTETEITAYRDMWPHLVVLRDDGGLSSDGLHEMDVGSLKTMLFLFQERTAVWPRRRLAVISDNGALPTSDTIQRLRAVRDRYLLHGIYPIFVLWETSWWSELVDELTVWHTRLANATATTDTRTDASVLEELRERSALRTMWSEIERRAMRACSADGGAQLLAEVVATKREQIGFDLHLVSHGTGDLLLAAIVAQLPAPVTTADLLASAASAEQARQSYLPLLDDGRLGQLSVFSVDAELESTDRVGPIQGSILSVVDDLLSSSAHDRRFGRTDPDPSPWERHDRSGRYRRIVLADHRHLDLAVSPTLHERLATSMLAHQSSDDARHAAAHLGRRSVRRPGTPTDPLAAAVARLGTS